MCRLALNSLVDQCSKEPALGWSFRTGNSLGNRYRMSGFPFGLPPLTKKKNTKTKIKSNDFDFLCN